MDEHSDSNRLNIALKGMMSMSIELDTLRKENTDLHEEVSILTGELIEVKAERDKAINDFGCKLIDAYTERDRYRDALDDLMPHIIHVPEWIKTIIKLQGHDDEGWLTHELAAFERDIDIARTALEASSCGCKNGRRGPNCHDYHPREASDVV